jgi:hypothetical protein
MSALVVQNAAPVSDLERMAKAFAASKLFGVQNVDQALALMLVAQAEGRHPASAAQDYNIIQGRPAKKADAMLRDFLAAGGKVEWHALTDEQADATFSHPAGGSARIDWTLKRAQAAGINNPMWKKYPRQMLRSRVVSEGVRTVCPGATSGMYVPEEVQDIVHAEPAPQAAAHTPEPATDAVFVDSTPFAPIVERKSSAQAKRDGDHIRINAEIDGADVDRLDELEATFDEWTSHLPERWLEPLRDRIQLRREEIAGSAAVADDEAALDAEFRNAVGVVRGSDLARNIAAGREAAA